MRLIPGKTKVSIELFKGIMLGDVIVAGVAVLMLIIVLISNLPWKLGICVGIVMVAIFLVIRMDELPNYMLLLRVLCYLGYDKRFGRLYTDQMLVERGAKGGAFDGLFQGQQEKAETPRERRARLKAEAKAAKEREKERARQRKEEDKALKSAETPEEEKEAIRARRKAAAEESMRKRAEAREKTTSRRRMEEIVAFSAIRDGYIEYLNRAYFGAVLEIDPVEFRFFSQHRRNNSIENCMGRILRSLHAGYSANIVKIERPIMYDSYLDREYDKLDALRESYEHGVLGEEELKARVDIEYDRINEIREYCGDRKVVSPFYYLCLFESDKHQLDIQIREAHDLLQNGEVPARRLDDRELAVFLKYTNQLDFDEREAESVAPEDLHLWAMPATVDLRARRVEVNHIVTHNFRVVNYPTLVGDAWLAGLMSVPGTKVV